MDINGNMELENFELVIGNVFEGEESYTDASNITEDMVVDAINKNIDRNRRLNRNVNLAIFDLVRNDLMEKTNENVRRM